MLRGAYNGTSGTAVYAARALSPGDGGALDAGSNAAFYLSGAAGGTAAQALGARALGAAFYDVSLAFDADPGWCATVCSGQKHVGLWHLHFLCETRPSGAGALCQVERVASRARGRNSQTPLLSGGETWCGMQAT